MFSRITLSRTRQNDASSIDRPGQVYMQRLFIPLGALSEHHTNCRPRFMAIMSLYTLMRHCIMLSMAFSALALLPFPIAVNAIFISARFSTSRILPPCLTIALLSDVTEGALTYTTVCPVVHTFLAYLMPVVLPCASSTVTHTMLRVSRVAASSVSLLTHTTSKAGSS